jgi:hypothetical protein
MERTETSSRSLSVYKLLLLFYPYQYIERHGAEMIQNFEDLQREYPLVAVWLLIISDFIISVPREHMNESTSRIACISFLTYIPFLTLFAFGASGQIFGAYPLQRAFMALVEAHVRVAFALIFVLPGFGFVLMLGALIADLSKQKNWNPFSFAFLRRNILILILAALGFGIVLFLPAHDMVPCYLTRVFSEGIQQTPTILQYCRTHY